MNVMRMSNLVRGLVAGSFTVIAVTSEAQEIVRSRVEAHSTDRWVVSATAGVPVRVVVRGDGGTDVDVRIYDENGRLIAQDTDLTDYCITHWTPWRDGRFQVLITNEGAVHNVYYLAVYNAVLH